MMTKAYSVILEFLYKFWNYCFYGYKKLRNVKNATVKSSEEIQEPRDRKNAK